MGGLIGDRDRLLAMADAARGARIIDAAERLADCCVDGAGEPGREPPP
jgi:hypothetical protein